MELHSVELHSVELHSAELHSVELHSVELHSAELHSVELYDLCCCGDKIKIDRSGVWGYVRREGMYLAGFVVEPEGSRQFG